MKLAELEFQGNSLADWLAAAAVAAGLLGLLLVARWLLTRQLRRLAARTANTLDDVLRDLVRASHAGVFALLAVYVGALGLELPGRVATALRGLAVAAVVLQAGLWGQRLLAALLARRRPLGASATSSFGVLRFAAQLLLWSLVLLLALDNLGIDITALVAGLGVGGIAVALATQRILGDLFASLSIELDEPFGVGDFIVVDDFAGTVERVGIKTTRLRSLTGEQLVFSNADLLDSRIRNFKRMAERRVQFGLGVTYQTGVAELAEIPRLIEEIVRQTPRTRFDRAHFKAFGDSALLVEVVFYVLDPDYNLYMDTRQQINLAIWRAFAARGIDFAYPTQTLFLRREAGGAPGVAAR
jgi:small-conductance mechanosensitive channel